MYSVAAFTEFYAGVYEITDLIFRLWYLVGAILVAAYMGMGTLYLLMRRRNAHIVMAILGMASIYAIIRVLTVDIDITNLTKLTGIGVMPTDVRYILLPVFNAFGTFALVGGALYSAYIFWRKRILPHRVSSNIFIAVGALLPALGGTHQTYVGGLNILFICELAGVIVMFIGFLRTKEVFGLYRFPLVHGFKKIEKDSTVR